jgi:hypothetical protein
LDIRDQPTLDAFEAEMSSERATEPLPGGPLTYEYYLAIHHHLFQDDSRQLAEIIHGLIESPAASD